MKPRQTLNDALILLIAILVLLSVRIGPASSAPVAAGRPGLAGLVAAPAVAAPAAAARPVRGVHRT